MKHLSGKPLDDEGTGRLATDVESFNEISKVFGNFLFGIWVEDSIIFSEEQIEDKKAPIIDYRGWDS